VKPQWLKKNLSVIVAGVEPCHQVQLAAIRIERRDVVSSSIISFPPKSHFSNWAAQILKDSVK
jgi:hypothetical protein